MRGFVAALGTAWLLGVLSAGPARADEEDWSLSARAGVGGVTIDGRTPLGPAVGADLLYGLTDAWSLRGSANVGVTAVSDDPKNDRPGGIVSSYALFAGLTYTVDVLRVVPYFEAGLGAMRISGAVNETRNAIGAQAGLGAEYFLNPLISVGGIASYVYAPFDLIANAQSGRGVPQTFLFSARISWILR
jgi:hypothetical protein